MKIDLANLTLPQEEIEVDGITYLVTAMSATEGLKFMEQQQESLDTGKADLALMKKVICKSVTKDGKLIGEDPKSGLAFDIIFSRKLGHLRKLYTAVISYNFEDVFTEPDSEE
jgi:hypothetical protein